MNENEPLQPLPLISIVENLSIIAVLMILFAGFTWGCGVTVVFMSLAGR